MKFIDIGHVAEQSGVRPSALRYYEEVGLISPAARRGLRRQFPVTVLLQLKLVAMGKLAGFPLKEIAGMFGDDGKPNLPRARLRKRADEIDDQLRDPQRPKRLVRLGESGNFEKGTHADRCSSAAKSPGGSTTTPSTARCARSGLPSSP